MDEGIELTSEDIRLLQNIVDSTISSIAKVPQLDSKLGLSDKFLGPLGEAVSLIKISKLHGEKAKYRWYGKFKRDYDLVVTENGKPIKYQIKSSSHANHFVFRVAECPFGDKASEVADQIKNGSLNTILQAIDDAIELHDVKYWLLTYLKKDGTEFYRLDKEALKSVAKQHYLTYYSMKHRASTHIGVSQKSGNNIVMLQGKRKGDPELLEPYRI